MDRTRIRFVFTENEGLLHALFYDEVVSRGLTHFAQAQWQVGAAPDEIPAKASRTAEGHAEHVLELSTGLGMLTVTYGWAHALAAAGSPQDAHAALDELRALRPRRAERDDQVVPVTFWSTGMHGPMPIQRELEVPSWSEIESNYSEGTRDLLARLLDPAFRPGRGGQLLLWHGETGTGKTTALRALAYEWRNWCGVHYITDPEKFFGEHADYMLTVMVQHQFGVDEQAFDEEGDGPIFEGALDAQIALHLGGAVGPFAAQRPPPWRLLVLEDAGELLGADARAIAGQGLSRFLNAVDGLIGQGLRFLVLVTTNEEVGKLHPAVARPGRAAARVPFTRLTTEEAHEWLMRHGVESTDGAGARTLASLYAEIEGLDVIPASRPLGFY